MASCGDMPGADVQTGASRALLGQLIPELPLELIATTLADGAVQLVYGEALVDHPVACHPSVPLAALWPTSVASCRVTMASSRTRIRFSNLKGM